ncbi:hypothetical protein LVJ94_02960 [Pendulispora rubella]|uniref:Uncharacterized protein n=1 Tax=Pendulispora rubella TaxID=2741070 RepID=A0ABZ2L767_9BACT
MFPIDLVRRKELTSLNRQYGAFGILVVPWVLLTVIVVGAAVLAAQEGMKDWSKFGWCLEKTYPDSYYSTLEDCQSYARDNFKQNAMTFIGIAISFFIAWAVVGFFGFRAARRLPKVLSLLDNAPATSVWAYEQKTFLEGSKTAANRREIVVGCVDGTKSNLWIRSPDEIGPLLTAIALQCPGITIGFDEEKSAQFVRDPRSMRPAEPVVLLRR